MLQNKTSILILFSILFMQLGLIAQQRAIPLGHTDEIEKAIFSPDGQYVLTGSKDVTAKLWRISTGNVVRTFYGHSSKVRSLAFSNDNRYIATGSDSWEVRVWNTATGEEVQMLKAHISGIYDLAFSPDNKYILSTGSDAARLWDIESGQNVRTFRGHLGEIKVIAFSPDGKYILTGGEDMDVKLWDATTGRLVATFLGHKGGITSVAFSPDGKYILTGSEDHTAKLWHSSTGKLVKTFKGHSLSISSVDFSADGRSIATGSLDKMVKIWDTNSGKEISSFQANPSAIKSVAFPPKCITPPCPFKDEDYILVASHSKSIDFLHVPTNTIEPIFQRNRATRAETNTSLGMITPKVSLHLVEDTLNISLSHHSGGIGKVAFYIGKRVIEEDINPDRSSTIKVDLRKYQKYFIPGQEMNLSIEAWEKEGKLASPLLSIAYTLTDSLAPNSGLTFSNHGYKARLFILSIGTGDYQGTDLDLSYAEQDANYMAKTLSVVGANFFMENHPYTNILTTCKECTDSPSIPPTKENIREAIDEIAQLARPQDVVVFYMSGYGKMYQDTWYYLTYKLGSDAIDDQETRENYTISSRELKNWFTNIAAQKQVVIIDACASGTVGKDFDLITSKNPEDIAPSKIRALDRLGKRAGLYIISTNHTNQANYETSPYGMGLLTYSLIQGMLGSSLREGEFVDVLKLFTFAKESVQSLAEPFQIKHEPMVYSPQGSESFDIGRSTPSIRQQIALPTVKPIFTSSIFTNADKFGLDDLNITSLMNDALMKDSKNGLKSSFIFIPSITLADAYSLMGSYTYNQQKIVIKAAVFRGNQQIGDAFSFEEKIDNLKKLSKTLIKAATEHIDTKK